MSNNPRCVWFIIIWYKESVYIIIFNYITYYNMGIKWNYEALFEFYALKDLELFNKQVC